MAAWLASILASMFKPDERFIAHRYHSSRLALIVGVLMLGSWFAYDLLAHDIVRYDLALAMGVMALVHGAVGRCKCRQDSSPCSCASLRADAPKPGLRLQHLRPPRLPSPAWIPSPKTSTK